MTEPLRREQVWLLVFEDKSVGPEAYTTEAAVREAYEYRKSSWACHVYVPDSAYATIRAKLAEAQAHIASLQATLDGEPCNEDLKHEAGRMSTFAEQCLKERDAAQARIKELEMHFNPEHWSGR